MNMMSKRTQDDETLTAQDVIEGRGRVEPPEIADLTEAEAHAGSHLARVHQMYLRDLNQIEALMQAIREGRADPAALAPALRKLPMAENLRLFGTVCGQACGALTNHHLIEDSSLFPHIERSAIDHAPVIARLRAEHQVIEVALEHLAEKAGALAQTRNSGGKGDNGGATQTADGQPVDRDRFESVAESYAELLAVLRSHFGYEETRLAPIMGRLKMFG